MKYIGSTHYGSLQQLKVMEALIPSPGPGQARVRVVASALNPADYKVILGQVKFLHGRRFPMCVGYDFSGVIEEMGAPVERKDSFKKGDDVFGFLAYGPANNQGAFAQYVIVDLDKVAIKPSQVSHFIAAAAATSGITALQALRDQGHLKNSNTTVLITGVSGGVGSLAVSVASRLGAKTTAIGSGKGLTLATELGASKVIDRKKADVFATISAQCPDPFDVIFDAAAAYRWKTWKTRLKKDGSFVTTLPSLAFAQDKLVSLLSPTRVGFVNVKSKAADLEQMGQWLASGMPVHIGKTIPVRDLAAGLESLMKNEILGRIAVDVENGF